VGRWVSSGAGDDLVATVGLAVHSGSETGHKYRRDGSNVLVLAMQVRVVLTQSVQA
jgi:hypothetical protein